MIFFTPFFFLLVEDSCLGSFEVELEDVLDWLSEAVELEVEEVEFEAEELCPDPEVSGAGGVAPSAAGAEGAEAELFSDGAGGGAEEAAAGGARLGFTSAGGALAFEFAEGAGDAPAAEGADGAGFGGVGASMI